MSIYVLGLGGGTNSGKTTLCSQITSHLPDCHVINQDHYFKTLEEAKLSFPGADVDWETCPALWMDRLVVDLKEKIKSLSDESVVIVEGHLVLNYPDLVELLNGAIFIEVDYELAQKRRLTRVYDPADGPGYFENIVWPGYLKILKEINGNSALKATLFLDAKDVDSNFEKVIEFVEKSTKMFYKGC